MMLIPIEVPRVASWKAWAVVLMSTLSLTGNSRSPPPSVMLGRSTPMTASLFLMTKSIVSVSLARIALMTWPLEKISCASTSTSKFPVLMNAAPNVPSTFSGLTLLFSVTVISVRSVVSPVSSMSAMTSRAKSADVLNAAPWTTPAALSAFVLREAPSTGGSVSVPTKLNVAVDLS